MLKKLVLFVLVLSQLAMADISDYMFRCSFDSSTTCEYGGNPVPLQADNITYATGKFGDAVNFSSASVLLRYNVTGNFYIHQGTISLWYKPQQTGDFYGGMFSDSNNVLNSNSHNIYNYMGDYRTSWAIVDNGGNELGGNDGYLNNTDFHHIALTWNNDTDAIVFYVNNASNPASGSGLSFGSPYYPYFYVGYGASGSGIDSARGLIDEFKIYNRSLTAGEIAELYTETPTTTTTTTTTSTTTTSTTTTTTTTTSTTTTTTTLPTFYPTPSAPASNDAWILLPLIGVLGLMLVRG